MLCYLSQQDSVSHFPRSPCCGLPPWGETLWTKTSARHLRAVGLCIHFYSSDAAQLWFMEWCWPARHSESKVQTLRVSTSRLSSRFDRVICWVEWLKSGLASCMNIFSFHFSSSLVLWCYESIHLWRLENKTKTKTPRPLSQVVWEAVCGGACELPLLPCGTGRLLNEFGEITALTKLYCNGTRVPLSLFPSFSLARPFLERRGCI